MEDENVKQEERKIEFEFRKYECKVVVPQIDGEVGEKNVSANN